MKNIKFPSEINWPLIKKLFIHFYDGTELKINPFWDLATCRVIRNVAFFVCLFPLMFQKLLGSIGKKKDRKRIFSHCIELNWTQLHDYSAVHNLQYVENLKKLFVKSQILFSLDLEFRLLESIEKRRIGNDLLHDCITGQLHQTRFCNSFWKFVKTHLVALPYIAKLIFFRLNFPGFFCVRY